MGSQFTLRIPLYGAQYPVKKGVEGLAGTCCWLAVRNTSLCQFIETSLARSGVHTQRYEGQEPAADDILIVDDALEHTWQEGGGRLLPPSYRDSVGKSAGRVGA